MKKIKFPDFEAACKKTVKAFEDLRIAFEAYSKKQFQHKSKFHS